MSFCAHTHRVFSEGEFLITGVRLGKLPAGPRTLVAQPGRGVPAGPGMPGVTMPCPVVPLVRPPSQEICPRTAAGRGSPLISSPWSLAWEVQQTGWLHYHCIEQPCFYVFPSVTRTQRAFICLELCWPLTTWLDNARQASY